MEHPKKNKAENTTPKNTTIIDSPIKKPESKIVYAEDLAKDLNNKAVDTNQKKKKKTTSSKSSQTQNKNEKKKDGQGFWEFLGLSNLFGKKKKDDLQSNQPQQVMSDEEKEKIKAPAGKSMIDVFDEEKSLDSGVEKIIKSHEFKWFKRKKKKHVNESIINDKINKATRYNPDFAIGLSQSQVDERTKSGLTNKVKTTYTKTYWEIIKDNIFTFFNILLIIVAICLCVIGEWKNCTFLVIMIANIAIGIFQEIRSKKTIEKLRLVTTPTASVIRDGKELKVPTDDIVLDDIISLSIGNQISADSIIVDGSIEVNESLLTGESLPVKKHTGDTVYAGSFVTSGSGTAKVIKVAEANWAISLQSQAKKFQKLVRNCFTH